MSLTLVGLGLCDEKDLTLRGIDAAKRADKVYVELYTSVWHGKDELEKIVGKRVAELKREDLEQHAGKIVDEAKAKEVVIFVPGDPLIATTHTTIIEQAKKCNIACNIVHNASIVSAIGEAGLHVYKFGASATVPFPEKTRGELPESVYGVLKLNKRAGLHTLLLLDITPGRCMTANEAIKTLLAVEDKRREGIFTGETEIVVFARAGSASPKIWFGRVADLLNTNFGEPPMVLIVPGVLHFTEREFLELLKHG
jgi:diphthine synthase